MRLTSADALADDNRASAHEKSRTSVDDTARVPSESNSRSSTPGQTRQQIKTVRVTTIKKPDPSTVKSERSSRRPGKENVGSDGTPLAESNSAAGPVAQETRSGLEPTPTKGKVFRVKKITMKTKDKYSNSTEGSTSSGTPIAKTATNKQETNTAKKNDEKTVRKTTIRKTTIHYPKKEAEEESSKDAILDSKGSTPKVKKVTKLKVKTNRSQNPTSANQGTPDDAPDATEDSTDHGYVSYINENPPPSSVPKSVRTNYPRPPAPSATPYHASYQQHTYSHPLEAIRQKIFQGCPSITLCGTRVVLFFSFRVKRAWRPCLAYFELVLNYAIVGFTIAAFALPGDSAVAAGGFVVMFVQTLVVQFWDPEKHESDFEELRDMLSYLYHGDDVKRDQGAIVCTALPVTFATQVASFAASVVTCVACLVDQSQPRRERTIQIDLPLIFIAHFAALVGILGGSLFFPIIYAAATHSEVPALAIVASVGTFVNEEVYLALLFRKSFCEFFKSCILSVLYDYVPLPLEVETDDLEAGIDWDAKKDPYRSRSG